MIGNVLNEKIIGVLKRVHCNYEVINYLPYDRKCIK